MTYHYRSKFKSASPRYLDENFTLVFVLMKKQGHNIWQYIKSGSKLCVIDSVEKHRTKLIFVELDN